MYTVRLKQTVHSTTRAYETGTKSALNQRKFHVQRRHELKKVGWAEKNTIFRKKHYKFSSEFQ